MPRLYFKYGTMGSSKSAQALMAKFNYEQKGMQVLLIKPSIDNRDDCTDKVVVKSRIGLESPAHSFNACQDLFEMYKQMSANCKYSCVIVDEAQFCTAVQIEQLKEITRFVPVLCYGLLNNFKCQLFEGSKRLVELCDSMTEIKSVCKCGAKSSVNARYVNGKVVTSGVEVLIGGNESYENMCYWCWRKAIENSEKE